MRLKRLVLQGYKTFATKTEFVFDEGITAIVGPNGSGKSNIADAIRWVLGEQSYSTLRGKRTVDMIFAGSQSRPRAGMAQAVLTLDNSDGWLPIDYTEVEIGRRAFRSGENEYILNGQKVRLKDITDLLATSGLAERTYTIIGQGLIDQALSLRADERRALFEEAAGISHYKMKRAETLRRLKETQRNLERVHDILAEIRPRLTSLKRQATRARNYEQVAADLRHLLRIWYGYRWEQVKDEMRLARETADHTEAHWQESRNALLAHQEQIEQQRRRINRRQQEANETQNRRDELRDQLEKARREAAILRERQHAIQRQLADIEGELPQLAEQQTAAQEELNAATAELASAQTNLSQTQTRLSRFNADFQTQQAEINRWRQKMRRSEEARQAAQRQLAQADGQIAQLRERQHELAADQEDAVEREEMVQVAAQVEQLTAVLQSVAEGREELNRRRDEIHDQRRALIDELKQLRRQQNERESDLNERRNQLARLESRVEMLDQMRQKELPALEDVTIVGRFASLITIPEAYQTALEAALAHRLATLVVADDDQLWQLVQRVQADQPLTAVALNGHALDYPDLDHPDLVGRAADLVTYPDRLAPAVNLLLGPILLVSDQRAAYELARTLPPGMAAVTPDGFVAHAGGLIQRTGQNPATSVLAREREWQTAVADAQSRETEIDAAETDLATLKSEINARQEQVNELQREEKRLGRLEQEADQRVTRAQRDLDRARQQRAFLERQQQAQAEEVTRLESRIERLEAQIVAHREEIEQQETAVAAAGDHLEELPIAEAQQQRQSLQQNIQSTQTIVAGRQAVVDSRRATLNQIDRQIDRLQERQASLQEQLDQLRLDDRESQAAALQQQLDALDETLQPLRARIRQDQKTLNRLEDEAAVLQRQTHERETQYTQAKIAFSQRQNQMEGLQDRIKADLGLVALTYDDDQTGPTPLPIGEVVEQLPSVQELPADIEETIQNYRGQMQRMGAINPDAPEEFEETQERFDFLTQQVEDLNVTEAQLREVITELDELTSRAFAQTVKQVNEVFGDTFTQLFGGGTGRLALTDPDDLTVSGVDIIARLPNRREQGLSVLSGGERSLTAAALIFSLLKVSPTPFCVMDEVDAALDEANINRFRELLLELSRKTQFVVITHNRGTVQAAHTIYGISMGSDSASQSISIKPEEYVKQASLV